MLYLILSAALNAQDSRTVVEPQIPPSCVVLTANQTTDRLNETVFDTARLQAAINACGPGQAVELQAGTGADAFLIQPITLAPGVTLLVDAGVTVYGSLNPADYACSVTVCTPLIYGLSVNGAGIMGLGVIDGRGGQPLLGQPASWWQRGDPRPRLVQVDASDNFTLYKITLQNSPKMHFFGGGNNLVVWGVKITAPGCDPNTYSPVNNPLPFPSPCLASPNTDGIDPAVEAPELTVSNMTITNSYISVGDDNIAVNGGNGNVTNLTVSHNHLYTGHGVSIGSQTSAGVSNVLVQDIAMDGAWGEGQFSLRIKSDSGYGGEVKDITYQNICIQNGGHPFTFDPYYSATTGNAIPNFHDITLRNIHVLNEQNYSTMRGYSSGPVYPLILTLDNVQMDGAQYGDFAKSDSYGPKVGNAVFTVGTGPVNITNWLEWLGGVSVIDNTVANNASVYDCTGKFVYAAGELFTSSINVRASQSATLLAIVQPIVFGSPSPTGSIAIFEGPIQVASTAISGHMSSSPRTLSNLTIPNVSAGTHTYTAEYSGDAYYAPLTFGTITVSATQGGDSDTTTAVTSSASQILVGSSVTITALVNSSAGVPSGQVTFFDNGNVLSTVAVDGSGNAILVTSSLGVGVHNIVASFGGGAGFKASNSAAVTVAALPSPAATAVSLTSSIANVPVRTAITFTATIGSNAGFPTGMVTFYDNGVPLGTATLNGTAQAVLTTSSLTIGTHIMTAVYGGNVAVAGSSSNTVSVLVTSICQPPSAVPMSASLSEGTSIVITLSGTVGTGCATGDTLAYKIVNAPSYGELTQSGANVTYTPVTGYYGPDSFTYSASDVNANPADSAPATVSITVYPAPAGRCRRR